VTQVLEMNYILRLANSEKCVVSGNSVETRTYYGITLVPFEELRSPWSSGSLRRRRTSEA